MEKKNSAIGIAPPLKGGSEKKNNNPKKKNLKKKNPDTPTTPHPTPGTAWTVQGKTTAKES